MRTMLHRELQALDKIRRPIAAAALPRTSPVAAAASAFSPRPCASGRPHHWRRGRMVHNLSICKGSGNSLEVLREIILHPLGLLFTRPLQPIAASRSIPANSKLMGLAPYGDPDLGRDETLSGGTEKNWSISARTAHIFAEYGLF